MYTDFSKVKKLAGYVFDAMEVRESGDKRNEWFLREGSPDWMRDVVLAGANDTSFYYAYEFAVCALEAIANADDDKNSIRDAFYELEPDVYTADLTGWLHENAYHVYWLTHVMEEFGPFDDGFKLLSAAQGEHKRSVAEAILAALIEAADNWTDPMDNLDAADFDYDWQADHNVYPFDTITY